MKYKPSSCSGCPLYEKPYGSPKGFIPSSGEGPILVVGEAGGRDEEDSGVPLIGASGQALFQQLARRDISRDSFTLHNVLSCRPPDNKLLKMPWEHGSISHCAPNLDKTIADTRERARSAGKTFVIITLGVVAFRRVMGFDARKDAALLKQDYYAYPFWNETYGAWVYNAPHPAYLVRGKTELWPVVEFVFKRALEISEGGLEIETPDYLLDPNPTGFDEFIALYEHSLVEDPDNPLSYDIETPYKKKKSEDEALEEDDSDHTILRCSFSFWYGGKTNTTSIKWSAEYMAGIERLFTVAKYVLGWNSDNYDAPRVTRQVKIHGVGLDGMIAWHILNTSLPMGLGFVTPYYWQTVQLWKHLSEASPAFYNAVDADAALRNYMGIKKHLVEYGLWEVYKRHWIELHKALNYMTGTGVLRDNEWRDKAEDRLQIILDELEVSMENSVPKEARRFKLLKKKPKDLTGWEEVIKDVTVIRCSVCRKSRPAKGHFKSKPRLVCSLCGKRWTDKHVQVGKRKPNPCAGATHDTVELNGCVFGQPHSALEQVVQWAKPLEFKLSKLGMTNYQKALKHQAILTRKERKVTFNEDAITLLARKYPKDPLYPVITDYRKAQKLLGTYVGVKLPTGRLQGGMEVGPDNRIHTTYSRNASTLRFTSKNPNLQNLPRPSPKDPEALVNLIRNLIVASPDHVLYARDFSGIEAVLSGYCALDPGYVRLSRRDVHTFYTVYALYELEGNKRITYADLPKLDWSDADLFGSLKLLKSRFAAERNSLYKHLVHAANFMQGAAGAQAKIFSETGIEYPVRDVQRVMDIYYSLFPSIRRWHHNVLGEAEKDGYLRNAFGYIHRFNRVYDYHMERGVWNKRPGAEANMVVAFKPQSMAVAIITEALLRLFYNRFEEAGQWLRLQVHDELLFEVPVQTWESLDLVVKEEMERPIPELRMPASWNMGEFLSILTEEKKDLSSPSRWGNMK